MAHLHSALLRVQHNLGLFPSIGHQTYCPLGIGKVGSLQEELVLREAELLV